MPNATQATSDELLETVDSAVIDIEDLERELNRLIDSGFTQLERFKPMLAELTDVLSGPRGIAHSIESEMD